MGYRVCKRYNAMKYGNLFYGTVCVPVFAAILVLFSGCSGRNADFDACGQIEAVEVVVSAESSGRILRLSVEEGDRLTKGERVGAVDSMQIYLQKKELEKRRRSALTKVVDIDCQLEPRLAQLENYRKDHERFSDLLSKDAGTQKQVDDIESQIAVLKGEIDALKDTYMKNNASVEEEMAIYDVQISQKEDNLSKCRIIAPVSGTVLTKYAEEGETVSSGKPLFRLADMDNVYVRAYFSTSQLSGLKLGDNVTVIPDDGTDSPKAISGKVTWISDDAEFTPKNIQTRDERADLVYAVKISVPNDGSLRLGMYAYVKLK